MNMSYFITVAVKYEKV